MKRVITYGTFDLLHYGHINLLRRARQLGDWEGKFDFLREEGCEVVYLPRTPEISSSQIKEDLHVKNK